MPSASRRLLSSTTGMTIPAGDRWARSEGGPVASFVWAVVPLITQEAPTLNYVTVYLKEHTQEILAVPALMIPATDRKG